MGSFGKAAEVFDQVGNDYLGNNLLKFNARTHFTNALMCHLANDVRASKQQRQTRVVLAVVTFVNGVWHWRCQDVVMTNRKLNEYKESDYQFADSRECRLIEVRCLQLHVPLLGRSTRVLHHQARQCLT